MKIERPSPELAVFKLFTDKDPYLRPGFPAELAKAAETIRSDRAVRAVILEGGARHFCAGAALDELVGSEPGSALARFCSELPPIVLGMPVPVLAAMEGHAIGGGLILGLWCDFAFLSEESLYGANFMALGFTPGMGSTVVVEEAFGAPLARELLFTGRMLKGGEIRSAGVPLSGAVSPRAKVRPRALALAEELASAPRASLELLKKELARTRLARFEGAVARENEMHAKLFAMEEIRRLIAERYPRPAGKGD
jgi:enoyl-CoA hydratase/carnithine racemase